MLGDFGISPFDLHYDILRWSVAAKLCGCKVLFLSVGAGPIRHPLSRRFVKAALALADYRSYRDTFSRKYLESIGFDTTGDNVYPDLAFSLPRAMIPVRRCRGGQGGVIGLGVMTYYSKRGTLEDDERLYNVYVEKVASFMSRLLDRKYTIRLLIGDVTYDRRVREDLRRLLEGRGVQYPGKIIDEPASSFEDVLSQLSTTDIVVASRFHNVLLGLMVTKLVVAVSYHEKVEALITEIGLGEFCQDIEHIDIEGLVGQITRLEEHSENIRSEIDQRIEEYRKALDEQYDRIFGGGIAKAAVPACAG